MAAENIRPLHSRGPKKRPSRFSLLEDITAGFSKLDRSVGPVDSFTGGTHRALKRLDEFVRLELNGYDETRNHPETRGTSRLSPYLHLEIFHR